MTRAISPLSLLYSITAGPILWFAHFMLVYMVAELGCRANFNNVFYQTPETIRTIVIVLTLVALVAVIAGGVLAYRNWQALPNAEGSTDDIRTRFLIVMGGLLTGLFVLSIVATAAPAFVVSVCDRAA
jgi:hypothetical protein